MNSLLFLEGQGPKQSRRAEQGLSGPKSLIGEFGKGELQLADVEAKANELFEIEW
ncbi:MAG: hypothetical protein ACREGC_04420 [Minisyncoccia bacterium]